MYFAKFELQCRWRTLGPGYLTVITVERRLAVVSDPVT
jgi:hypothetical protein